MEIKNGGDELKRLRQIGKLSQSELCKLSGIARSRISAAECGYTELTDGEAVRAERVIRRAISDVYRGAQSVIECGHMSPSGV